MKFLILISFLITPILCKDPDPILLAKNCAFGDSDPACNASNACSTPKKCPKTCDQCPHQKNFNKVTFKRVECLKNRILDGQSPVACWQINFKNQNGKEIVYFYKKPGDVAYYGNIQSYPNTEIVAIGDVVKGEGAVTFSISSELTEDSFAEVNTDSSKVPIVPGMYEVKPLGSAKQGREIMDIDPEVAKEMFKERSPMNLNARANPPKHGYVVNVLPVLDWNICAHLGYQAYEIVAGLLKLAAVAFDHSSLDIKFSLKFKDPVRYDKKLSASAEGYVSTLQTDQNGPRFNYSAVSQDVNVILFFTYTFPDQIDENYRISYGIPGGTCRNPAEKVAIINYFATHLSNAEAIRRTIATILGIKADYIPTPNSIKPAPRFSKSGKKCTSRGGFMDLPVGAKFWTECSNDDVQKAFLNGDLNCLEEVKCPKMDYHNLCPILAKNVDNACSTKFMKDSCPLSCERRICSGPVLANATLPSSYKCQDVYVCKDDISNCHSSWCNLPPGSGGGNLRNLCKKTCKLC